MASPQPPTASITSAIRGQASALMHSAIAAGRPATTHRIRPPTAITASRPPKSPDPAMSTGCRPTNRHSRRQLRTNPRLVLHRAQHRRHCASCSSARKRCRCPLPDPHKNPRHGRHRPRHTPAPHTNRARLIARKNRPRHRQDDHATSRLWYKAARFAF